MAILSTNAPDASDRQSLEKLISGIAIGAKICAESNSRIRELEKLNAKSDAELAELGVNREQTAHKAFQGLLFD